MTPVRVFSSKEAKQKLENIKAESKSLFSIWLCLNKEKKIKNWKNSMNESFSLISNSFFKDSYLLVMCLWFIHSHAI